MAGDGGNDRRRCYGWGSMFGADEAICGACNDHDGCMDSAKVSLAKTTIEIGANNVASLHVSARQTGAEIVVKDKATTPSNTANVSKNKASVLLKQITGNGEGVVESLRIGANPFGLSAKPKYIKKLIDIKLSGEGYAAQIRFMMGFLNKPESEIKKTLALVDEALDALGLSFEEKV